MLLYSKDIIKYIELLAIPQRLPDFIDIVNKLRSENFSMFTGWLYDACDHIKKSSLSGALMAKKAYKFIFFDRERQVFHSILVIGFHRRREKLNGILHIAK